MPRTRKDLIKCLPNYAQFAEFILKFRDVIDCGKLAELYCSKLFDLTLTRPHNSSFDAVSDVGEKIEIKHRFYSGTVPPGMKINLQNIDYVFYVELSDDLLPSRIFKIQSTDINYTTGKRVSFKRAFKENKVELIFQS